MINGNEIYEYILDTRTYSESHCVMAAMTWRNPFLKWHYHLPAHLKNQDYRQGFSLSRQRNFLVAGVAL